ncbi:MAG: bifunctional UDP-N-acetylglucosamine diphosphorylase/glucosamine-1-phosphate N-acetyltransferase GlmU [Schwartzia sp.]|nr:bifunctional UDP-N-acetylglucosamine diphosphorylase/glucosamine-1-phosphate N-acetyltransferase GlmU [Schwartzia sp. (in: firmicutes)]
MSELIAVILAAGKGTRMKSALPKVLHRVCGKAMVSHVLDAAKAAGARRNVVVVGFGAEAVREALSDAAEVVVQEEQLGTGHAVLQTETCLAGERGTVMILCGDTPLLTTALLKRLYDAHVTSKAQATVLTAILPDATGYGRVIRTAAGDVEKIVEHKDATEDERKVREVNAGIYCFEKEALFAALRKVGCDNAQGEYYLPDALAIIREAGGKIAALAADDFEETLGVNSRAQLAEAEKILRRRKNRALMDEGVTLMDPDSTFVDTDVIVGRDTVIYPFTWLEGATTVGEGCVLGPSSRFSDARIGDGVTAHFVYAHECEIGDGVTMGPYVHLRPGTKLAKDVKIGNFVEVKNSVIGEGSKLPHLQYIGDCDMGAGVNMGCGTITVNYDGRNKFRTTIGDRAFVGCNSNLVAPVSVGNDAYIAAGSTVTRDVPPENLAVARARQKNIPNWSDRRL